MGKNDRKMAKKIIEKWENMMKNQRKFEWKNTEKQQIVKLEHCNWKVEWVFRLFPSVSDSFQSFQKPLSIVEFHCSKKIEKSIDRSKDDSHHFPGFSEHFPEFSDHFREFSDLFLGIFDRKNEKLWIECKLLFYKQLHLFRSRNRSDSDNLRWNFSEISITIRMGFFW